MNRTPERSDAALQSDADAPDTAERREAVALFSDERMCAHDAGPGHPERPARLRALLESLRSDPLPATEWMGFERADDTWFPRLHDPDYVERTLALDGSSTRLDPDTVVGPESIDAARLAAGAAWAMVRTICAAEGPRRSFALVRPPGHHAERGRAMGFCLFGNMALAAAAATELPGIERVLVLDWDVHHGNGTQDLLWNRGDVALVDLHQDGIYPGSGDLHETGAGAGLGATVNVPLPGGCGDAEYLAALEAVFVPFAERFDPDLLLVSAGFDAHWADPLAGQRVSSRGFAAMCGVARRVAERHCGGRLGLLLEGGYELDALTESVRGCIDVLAGASPPPVAPDPGRAAAMLERVATMHHLPPPRPRRG